MVKKESKLQKVFVASMFLLFVSGLIYINAVAKGGLNWYLGVYGSIMVTYLFGKMLLSFFYKPAYEEAVGNKKVSVIIPSYNEKPDAVLQTVESIMAQDYPIHEIFFVDDGSADTSGYEAILQLKKEYDAMKKEVAVTAEMGASAGFDTNLIVHRLKKNSGKRHAQIWAFKQATGDVFFTVDSDGYVHTDAVRELLKPFNDEDVQAVTGHINARNKNDNWFTRLLDMRYDNAFRVERAAQSVTGNVLVCSGPISCYRREVVMDNIEHYGSQTFLGDKVQAGDDRCLTNYAILKGKTLYQSTARCDTDVPGTFKQFFKQQIRWNKSFFRESLVALKVGFKKPRTLVWVLLELSLWLLFGIVILLGLVLKAKTVGAVLFLYYLAYLTFSAWARNVFYILKHPLVFLLAPVYGIIHLGLLFPLRFYALLTIKSTGWGTR